MKKGVNTLWMGSWWNTCNMLARSSRWSPASFPQKFCSNSIRLTRISSAHFLFWSRSQEWPMTARKSASIIRNFVKSTSTFLCLFFFSPYNVVEHWHEDDLAFELLWVTLSLFHKFLNLFEEAKRCESWEYFPLELHRLYINSIHILQMSVLKNTTQFYPSKPRSESL